MIVRSSDHYRLDLEGWEVDLEIVEALTERAFSISASDPATALQLLETTLALWSGPALVVDGEPISVPISSQFELARLEVEEARVDAMIECGQFEKAESLAIQMVDAEPYRERRWGQMMRAQVGSGRTTDALMTFRRVRRRLVEDIGVEPGPELRSLEASILAQEHFDVEHSENLDPPPRPNGPLVGRERLLERAEAALGRYSTLVLVGAPGIGKTRVAIEIAGRAEATGRPVGWIDLRNALIRGSWPGGARRSVDAKLSWRPGGVGQRRDSPRARR